MKNNPYEPPTTQARGKPSRLNRIVVTASLTIAITVVIVSLLFGAMLLKQALFQMVDDAFESVE